MSQVNATSLNNGGLIGGLCNFAGNTIGGTFNLVGNITSNTLGFAGNTLDGALNLTGQVVNIPFDILGGLGGCASNPSLSTGQGSTVISGGGSGGNIFNNLSNACAQIGNTAGQIANEQLYRDIARRSYGHHGWGHHWGWGHHGCFGPYGLNLTAPMSTSLFYPPVPYPPIDPMSFMYNGNMGFNQGYNSFGMQSYSNNNNNNLLPLDKLILESNYNNNGANGFDMVDAAIRKSKKNGKDSGNALDSSDPQTLKKNTPAWVRNIQAKQKKGEELTENEEALLEFQDKILKENSPYVLQEDGTYEQTDDNKLRLSPLGEEIMYLYNLLKGGNRASIQAYISGLEPDKLSSMETWFPDVIQSQLNIPGASLRGMIKDASLCGKIFSWTGINTDWAKNMYDIMDNATTKSANPSNIAASFRQALRNHRIGGLGVDEARVKALLKRLEGNPELAKAVQEEYRDYGDLSTDINKKMFLADEVKDNALKILYGNSQ